MIFSACSPLSTKARSRRLPIWSRTIPETATPPGRSDALQPRCDVDAVAKNIVVLNDDIAKIDAEAKLDPLVVRYAVVARRHVALNVCGAGDGIHDARELYEHAVAGELYDTALKFADL